MKKTNWKSYLAVFTLKTILALLLLLFLVWLTLGCARVSYQTDKGEKFTYTRFGNQKLHGVEVKAGDKSLKLKSSEGAAGDLATALKNMSELIPATLP